MLEGKVALITGGTRGIGLAIAREMAKNGARLALVGKNVEEENPDMTGITGKIYSCDVASFEETRKTVKEIIEDFGHVDILVNNAGIVRDRLILAMKEEDFDCVIDVNLKGPFNMTKHLFSHMAKRRQGSIINIASVSGLLGTAGQANYVSSKAGLIGLTKTSAREFAQRGITCNSIAPGFIETDMTKSLPGDLKEEYLSQIPMKRFGQAEDIAKLAVFLASDGARYITGEVIKVDGGLCMA